MNVRLPYSKTKRYLTGVDWIIATLDHMTRSAAGVSNASQIALEIRGRIPPDRFRQALAEFGRLFPVLAGRPARDWNLAPWWSFERRANGPPIRLELHHATSADEAFRLLEQAVNAPMRHPREHVVFHLISAGTDRQFVAMTFDHRIFDAFGAEAFLDLFQCWLSGTPCRDRIDGIILTEPAHLSDWKRKFDAGKQFNRKMLELARLKMGVLPRPQDPRGFRLRLIAFDEAQSRRIEETAYRKAGYLMLLPYTLGTVIRVLDRTFRRKGIRSPDYVVSTSVDLRAPENEQRDIFFNRISFLLFGVSAALAGDEPALLESLKTQMYDQVKARFPQHLAEATHLMRIAPLPLLGRLIRLPLRGEFASYGFSQIGRTVFTSPVFMGAPVQNLFHMPLMPVPPGLGFVINRFGNRFNAMLSYVEGLLDEEDVRGIEADVRQEFGA